MMKGKKFKKFAAMILSAVLLIASMSVANTNMTKAEAATSTVKCEQLYVPTYAAMSGKIMYYAVGTETQGGQLYMYNTSTKCQRKISNLFCSELTVTKNNLYCTVNRYIGSDGADRYIYKLSRDGKKAVALASGFSPVVVGKNIYYIGVKKFKTSYNRYENSIGIYRMDSNGKHKKCIKKFTGSFSTSKLIAGKNRVIFTAGNGAVYAINTKGKMSRTKLSSKNVCINSRNYGSWRMRDTIMNKLPISNNKYGYRYNINGGVLARYKGNDRKTILNVSYRYSGIDSVVDCGDYLFAVVDGTYAYVVSKSGKGLKIVATGLFGN